MNSPFVSIVMSTYNGSKYILETIDSVMSQAYKSFEFIIINDHSTDNTEEMIFDYIKKDKRIIYIKNKRNLGLTKSLNVGLDKSKGKYIARIDDNDLWAKEKLKKQIEFLEKNPSYGVIGTNFVYLDDGGREIGKRRKMKTDKQIKDTILKRNPFVHVAVIFRRSLITKYGGYDEKCKVGQDFALWLKLGLHTKMYNIQEYLTYIRLTKNGISAKKVKAQHRLALEKCIEYKNKYPNFYKAFLYRLFFFLMPKFLFDFFIGIKCYIERTIFS